MNRIRCLTKLTTIIPEHSPKNMAVDNNGTIYCTTDSGVWKIKTIGSYYHRKPKLIMDGTFNGIVWNVFNNALYLCSSSDHRIFEYSIDTKQTSILSGTGTKGYQDGDLQEAVFSHPRAIALDKNGNLFIAESHYVRKIDLHSKMVSTVAIASPIKGQTEEKTILSFPSEIAVSKDGTIFICNTRKNLIQQIKNDTVCFAGIYCHKGSQDGPINSATFDLAASGPWTFDTDGSLLIPHYSGYVRRVNFVRNEVSTYWIGEHNEIALGCLASDQQGNIYFSDCYNEIWKMESLDLWRKERLLWIAHLKEKNSSECHWTKIPREVIRIIIGYWRAFRTMKPDSREPLRPVSKKLKRKHHEKIVC